MYKRKHTKAGEIKKYRARLVAGSWGGRFQYICSGVEGYQLKIIISVRFYI